jgi:hypothetical protein
LRVRLSRQGFSSLLVAGASSEAGAGLPSSLLGATARASSDFAGGRTIDLATASVLAGEAIRTMTRSQVKALGSVLALAFALAGAQGFGQHGGPGGGPQGKAPDRPGMHADVTPVGQEAPIRVVYLTGPTFSREVRYLARSLDEAREIRMDLRVIRPGGAGEEIPAGRYDVYILSDLPADGLTKLQDRLVEDVEAGAGMILLGGPASYVSGGWGRSGLARLIPTRLGPDPDWAEPAGGVRVVPGSGKLSRSLLGLEPDPVLNARIWGEFPTLPGLNRLGPLKPSTVLLAGTGDGQTFMAVQEVGKGRVLAIAGETWPWVRQPGASSAAHGRFWQRGIRWAGHRAIPDP